MDTKKAHKVLQEVAKQKGITVEKVIREIDISIANARKRSFEMNDPIAIKEWQSIPCVGSVPTAVEFLAYLGEKVSR